MNSRDVTEILKVFEKRITKLESRVTELESISVSDERFGTTYIHDKNTSMDALSVQTLSYDSAERCMINNSRKCNDEGVLSEDLTSDFSKITRAASIESSRSEAIVQLEDGEIFEGEAASSVGLHGTPRGMGISKKLSKSADYPYQRLAKASLKARPKPDSEQQSRRSKGRERSKSENPTLVSISTAERTEEQLSGKTELRYGLVVQFPSEG